MNSKPNVEGVVGLIVNPDFLDQIIAAKSKEGVKFPFEKESLDRLNWNLQFAYLYAAIFEGSRAITGFGTLLISEFERWYNANCARAVTVGDYITAPRELEFFSTMTGVKGGFFSPLKQKKAPLFLMTHACLAFRLPAFIQAHTSALGTAWEFERIENRLYRTTGALALCTAIGFNGRDLPESQTDEQVEALSEPIYTMTKAVLDYLG